MAVKLPPPPIFDDPNGFGWQDWQRQVQAQVKNTSEALPWSSIDFTGSNLTDILTKEHNALQSTQGGTAGEKYHLTASQWTAINNGDYVLKSGSTMTGALNITTIKEQTGTHSSIVLASNGTVSLQLIDYADDTAAASGGVPVGGLYRTSGAVKVRIA